MPNMTVTCLPNFKKAMIVLLFFTIALNTFSQTHTPITTSISPNIGGYWEYLPADYATSNKTYPLLLFFHGKAERGSGSQTDLQLVLTYGPPKEIRDGVFPKTISAGGNNYSFIVISPQLQNTAIETAQDFNILMNYIRHHYRIDESRIYLTGLSLGAGRILYSAASSMSNANSIAGMVAASSDWTGDTVLASTIGAANVPLWLATNTQDPTIPYSYTVWWKDFLSAYTPPMNPQPLLDTFGVKGHDSWTQLFDPNFRPRGVNVYEWLLQYNRGMDTATRHVYPYISMPDTVTLPVKSITLDGSASSTDSGALIISYQWKVLSGPVGYQLNNSTSSVATLTKLSPGKYTVQLTVSNNKGVSGSSNAVVVTVQGQNPLAVIQAPSSISLPVDSVTLDGSGSYDPLGTITSYNWWCSYGAPGYVFNSQGSSIVKVSKLTAGLYDFVLRVSNNREYISFDTVSVVVKNASVTGPVAVIRNPGLVTKASATLDASASYTGTGRTISKFEWNYISGPKGYIIENNTNATTKVSNLVSGTYTFQVKISDSKGSGSGRVTFTVNPAAAIVHAVITGPTSVTLPVDSVVLDGSSSSAAFDVLSYNWTVLSGPAGYGLESISSSVFKIKKMKAGVYKIMLTVKNVNGYQDSDTVNVTVNPAFATVKAIINAPSSITLPVDSVLLDGSSSSSSNGSLTYNWRVVSGPSGYSINNATSSIAKVTTMKAGNYVFLLAVKNATGQQDSTTVTVTVNPAAPIVKAIVNAPASITLPVDSVLLDGSASYSTNGGLIYNWMVLSGPSGYTLNNAFSSILKVSKMSAGSYSFRLTVRNSAGQADSTMVSLLVNNATPTVKAIINAPASITLPVDSVLLDGIASTSSNGGLVYNWRVVSGPAGYVSGNQAASVFKVSKMAAGTYVCMLTVNNTTGQRDSTTASVVVNPAVIPTVHAVINAPASITLPVDSVLLNGSASTSSNGGLVYNWTVVSGPAGYVLGNQAASVFKVSKMAAGTYVCMLTVNNTTGQRDSITATVVVNPAVIPTVHAAISAPGAITLPVDSVALDGSASTSSNGGLIYNWRVVSGPAGYVLGNQTVPVFKVSKMAAGTYVFLLAVSNGTGQRDSTTATVTVNQAAATGPVAVIVNPGTVTTSSVTLDASGSYTVPGRTITSWLWNYMSGPKNAIIQSPNSSTTTITNLTNGTYTYRVKVTDKGGSSSQTVTFTVNLSAGQRVANASQHAESIGSLELNEPKAQRLKLSPVPTIDQLNLSIINASRGKVTVNIADMSGRIVLRKNGADKTASIWNEKVNVTNLSGGSYFVTVAIGSETFSGRFVKLSN